jgi:hypothetical protein
MNQVLLVYEHKLVNEDMKYEHKQICRIKPSIGDDKARMTWKVGVFPKRSISGHNYPAHFTSPIRT